MSKSREVHTGVISDIKIAEGFGFIQSHHTRYFFHKHAVEGGLEYFQELRKGLPVEFFLKNIKGRGIQAFDVRATERTVEYAAPRDFVMTRNERPKFGKLFGDNPVTLSNVREPGIGRAMLEELARQLGFNAAVNVQVQPKQDRSWTVSATLGVLMVPQPASEDTISRFDLDLIVDEAQRAYDEYMQKSANTNN